MSLGVIGSRWQQLSRQLAEQVTVLIVDDEPLVAELLGTIVEDAGWAADIVGDAEQALQLLRSRRYGLVVVDKNLPGHDGIDLIGQLAREGNDSPCVLVTGYPSTETISRALAQGAVDYVSKPFDDVGHLQNRLTSIVDQRRQARVLGQMVRDLNDMATGGGADEQRVREIGWELFAHKQLLAARPDALIVDIERGLAEQVGRVLTRAGVKVVYTEGEVVDAVQAHSPMSVYLTLDLPDAAAVVAGVRASDPALGVLVSGREGSLTQALETVHAGATDFVLGALEGPEILVRRVKRAAARARKLKLQQRLVTLLHQVATELNVDLTGPVEGMVRLMSGEGGATTSAEGEAVIEPPDSGVEISSLFADESSQPSADVAQGEDGPMQLSSSVDRSVDRSVDGSGAGQSGDGSKSAGLSSAGTTFEQQVEHGLGSVDASRQQEAATVKLLRAYRTLVETIRFFSDVGQPSEADLARFVGDLEQGAMASWLRSYHELRDELPDDIVTELDYGLRFAHPWPPWWLKT